MIRKRLLEKHKVILKRQNIEKREINLKSFLLGMLVMLILVIPTGYVFSKELNKKTIDVYYDDIKVIVNAEEIPLRNENGEKVEPFLYQGTTYVPLRAISENFEKTVWWDDNGKRVIIFEESEMEKTLETKEVSGEQKVKSKVDIHNLPVPVSKKALIKEGMEQAEIYEILGLPQCMKETKEYQEDIYYFEDGKFLVIRMQEGSATKFLWQQETEKKEGESEKNIIQETIIEEKDEFEDNELLQQSAEKIVVGKIRKILKVSNYNEKTGEYAETYTYANVEILENCLEKQFNEMEIKENLEVMFYGGMIPYEEYEKSLEVSEREELDRSRGFIENPEKKKETFVISQMKEQVKVEEGKTYLMYLVYSDTYEKYVPISEVYGIKEYNVENDKGD